MATYIIGIWNKREELFNSGKIAIMMAGVSSTIAAIWLFKLLIGLDFQNEYVASYTSRDLPFVYILSAFWAGSAGSLLLWAWLIAIFAAIIVVRKKHDELTRYAMPVIMLTQAYFFYMLATVADPFRRLSFIPPDGNGLNPLLQDPGMFFHPPTLFIGYAGFIIPFAYMIAGVYLGRSDWIYSIRRWTLFAWLFLTLGNFFGSYWAYTVLNWGGYWGWDPVENASFLPWLTATAFYHSTMIQERKDGMKIWNILLILFTWELVVYGTLLTRSGIISSVHTFGQSTIAPYFIYYMIFALALTLILLTWKYEELRSKKIFESFASRESSFLANNWLFIASTASVLWGTTYPLLSEAVRGYKVMVGPSFYNQINVPIGIALVLLMAVCPIVAWRKASLTHLKKSYVKPVLAGIIFTAFMFILGVRNPYAMITVFGSVFAVATHVVDLGRKYHRAEDADTLRRLAMTAWDNRRTVGGYICHLSAILIVIGVAGSALYETTETFTLYGGQQYALGGYTFALKNLDTYNKDNKEVASAFIDVYKDSTQIGTGEASIYYFAKQKDTIVKPYALLDGYTDIYFSAQSVSPNSASVKIKVIPLMVLIWTGGYLLIIGIIVSLSTVVVNRRRTDVNIQK
ncbi:MAG TPA: heme lyase CcmF/NrfE family subunit [Candidatus Methanoperedenaceae archaeon]|nr:heme lyase CcmF/NrfE family subunit [Candidatus Methanoperedenaceae archaeon]